MCENCNICEDCNGEGYTIEGDKEYKCHCQYNITDKYEWEMEK